MENREKKYLKSGGSFCPICGSKSITLGTFEMVGSAVYSKITCDDCRATWDDIYKLAGCKNIVKAVQ